MKFFSKINKPIGFIFLVISLSIFYILLKRDHFNYVCQVAYFQLYPSYDSINIKAFKPVNDSVLEIQTFNSYPGSQQWSIYTDADSTATAITGSYPFISLKKGTHTYKVLLHPGMQQFEIEAAYIPRGRWDDRNFTEPNITILRSRLPSADNFAGLEKWQQHPLVLSEEEKQFVNKILSDSIGIAKNDTLSKGEKISRYLCSRLSAYMGHMNDSIRRLSVCRQYKTALKGNKIDCGVYSNIFSMFAQQAGVVNRIVELKHNFGTFNSNIHIFNEYFDEIHNCWVATDIMLNNVNYSTATGELLNAVQVKNFLKSGSSISARQTVPFSDSITTASFDSVHPIFYSYYSTDKDLYYYYDFNAQEAYSFKQKAKRFFTKNPWYEVYSDRTIFSNKLFYLKQFLFILWLLLLVIIAGITFSKRKSW